MLTKFFTSLGISSRYNQQYKLEEAQKRNDIRKCLEEQSSASSLTNKTVNQTGNFKPLTKDCFQSSEKSITKEDALNILWPDL